MASTAGFTGSLDTPPRSRRRSARQPDVLPLHYTRWEARSYRRTFVVRRRGRSDRPGSRFVAEGHAVRLASWLTVFIVPPSLTGPAPERIAHDHRAPGQTVHPVHGG